MKRALIGGLVALLLGGCIGKEDKIFSHTNEVKSKVSMHDPYMINYSNALEFIRQSTPKPKKNKKTSHKDIVNHIKNHLRKDSRVKTYGDLHIFQQDNLKIEIESDYVVYKRYPNEFNYEGKFVYVCVKNNKAETIVSFGGEMNPITEYQTDLIIKSKNSKEVFEKVINDKEQEYMPMVIGIYENNLVHFFDFRFKRYEQITMKPEEFNSSLEESVKNISRYVTN